MLNQTAVIDSKGESFELDLNLQDANHKQGRGNIINEHVIVVQMIGFAYS